MKIKKRDGRLENLSFDKIVYRLKKLQNDKSLGQLKTIDTDVVAQKVVSTIYDGVSSTELDEEAARIAISMTENLEFSKLASRLVISNMHKNTTECFSEVMEKLYNNVDKNNKPAPVLADDIIALVRKYKDILNETIDYSRDYLFDYFGFKTLEKSYLMKLNGKVLERPQHLYMRVAIQVHKDDIDNIIKTYELISQHYFTFASPTLFNAGSRLQNLSSCFHEDTIVATVNKGPIKIKDVEIGDLVITHLGNVKKVEQLHKNLLNNRKLYEINITKTEKIKVTDNHKLWAITKTNKNSRTNSYTSPRWISIQDLEKGDYISIPNKIQNIDYIKELDTLVFKDLIENKKDRKSNYTVNLINDNKIILKTHWEHNGWTHVENSVKCSREHSSINRYWAINNSFAKFLGIFYGDGHIMTGKDTHGNVVLRGIGITIHNMNNELLDYCKEIGLEIFGINPTIHIMKEQNIIQVLYNSVFIGEIFNELFGRHFNTKKIWYEMYKWDREMIISLLEGLVTTDGCISKNNGLSFQMSNVKFMRDLYYLLRNNNIDTSYGKEKRAKNGTENHVQINIPISEIDKYEVNKYYKDNRMKYEYKPICKNQFSAKIIDGFKFLKFEDKIEITENLPEYVYTLGVEDDHSYNIGGIIAENCFLIGTHDSIGGIYKTISDCAQISKVGGGIGVHINNIRSKGSVIRGTNGHSDGIIPMLKVYNSSCLFVNQCILPHIPVFSKDGIKRMDEITTDDYLITHDGSYKKVNEVIVSKKKEEILEINIACGIEPLKCTKIHDIYTIKSNRTNGKARLISQLERGLKKPEFIEAERLTINDYVGFPIPTFEQDNLDWSLDKCRLYGIMLGDGNISFSKDGGNRYQITLNNDTKLETKAFVIEQLLKNNIQYWVSNECEINWVYKSENIEKIGITDKMLYDKNHDKYCVPEVLHLPKNKIAMIMKGLMESDGYKTNTGVFFSSTSKNLIQSLRYICLRFGMLTNCQTIDKVGQIISQNKKGKDIISRKIAYYLRLPKIQLLKDYKIIDGFENTNAYNYFEFEGILYCRIKSINKINYEGEVYDFNMIDNHNYLTDMGLVHNSGKRKGSFAMYLSPEHPDIFEFLDLRKNQGSEDMRARDLFLAMWISDLFMKQVEKDGDWYLIDPDECPGLSDCYGEEYEELYWKYVEQDKYKRKVKAQEIWMKILESQIETGTPYILYKDKCNQMSNQKNIGTIKSSNLCSEVLLYSDHEQYAVCNLASIALPKYVEIDPVTKLPFYNHQALYDVAKHIVLPMNNVIDFNHYPVPETKKSNMLHRPIGVGIQGLSCTFIKMRYPFDSEEAKKLNKEISETIYFALLTGSMELAKKDGPYSTFKGSPMSEGKFQFDLHAEYNNIDLKDYISGRWDWETLRKDIIEFGIRNSTVTTCMPTASSAQIMGNTESFEPFDSCIFKRRVLSGEYIVVNKYLVKDLTELKLWNKELKDQIITYNGSIQEIDIIPDDIKELYKTVWEIKMKDFIQMSSQRSPFICMTQSLNLFMASPTIKKLTSMHFYAWKQGLKTGMYYLRSKATSNASKFTIDPNMEKKIKEKQKKGKSLTKKEEEAVLMCSIENKEACMMCTS
jgi:ribonucleoside-diphosphate reductase alpha subunit